MPTDAPAAKHSLLNNIRFVITHIWRYSRMVFPLTLLGAVSEVLTPFIAIFLPKLVIDALQDGVAESELLGIIGIATLLLAIVNIGSNCANRLVQIEALHNRIRFILYAEEKTITMDYANIEDPAGQTAREKAYNALDSNNSGAEAMVVNLVNFISHTAGLVLYTAVVAGLNPWIVGIMLTGSLLSIWATRRAQNYEASRRNDLAEASKKNRYLQNQANDYLNAKDIRLYDLSGWLSSRMDRLIDNIIALRRNVQLRYFAADSLDTVIALVRDGLSYAYLISLVLQDAISVGDFTLLFAAIAGISTWIAKMTIDINLVIAAAREIGYYRDFLEIPDAPRITAQVPPQITEAPEIVFDNVSFRYPGSEQWILKDFNLHIPAGEKLAIVGVNGAGKTTLVKLLTGLYRPTEGRILIAGHDSAAYEREQLFELFAPVFQEVRVMAMSLERNVALQAADKLDSSRVRNCLELAGLNDKVLDLPQGLQTPLTRVLETDGIDLSGGQAQKLMLARALYKEAPIVIMDEPTAALDALAEAELYQRYNEMVGRKTSLYISHRLASTRFCDRIAFISEGRISELGSHQELLNLGGAYAEMFTVQAHYYQEEVKEASANV